MDERKIRSFWLAAFVLVLICGQDRTMAQSTSGLSPSAGVSGEISRVGDATHLEFKGRADWTYETPKRENDTITVSLPPFDEKTLVQLQTWSCPFIKEVKVNKQGPDGRYEVQFVLTGSDVESFDYLTDEPSNLIFDFYRQTKAPEKATASAAAPEASQVSTKLPEKGEAPRTEKAPAKKGQSVAAADKGRDRSQYEKSNRSPAGSEVLAGPGGNAAAPAQNSDATAEKQADIKFERGVFDSADPNYDRFRIRDYQIRPESVIASQQNIYIRFPMLALSTKRFHELMAVPPEYEVTADGTQESKDAQFLVMLFNKQQTGSFFETLKYFEAKYPNSKYDEIVKNLTAESHIRLYRADGNKVDYEKFRSIYHYLIEKYPDSVLRERQMLLLGFSSLEQGEALETIQDMQAYLKAFPKSTEKDHVRFAMAEAYQRLSKYEDAINMYEDVRRSPVDRNYAVEAQFRIGDVYFKQLKYKEAFNLYQAALKENPSYKTVFPNAYYNSSEALFWQGQYKSALNSYIEFMKLFPADKYVGQAMARAGEVLQILGADQSRVMGAFLETYFRYPDSLGAEVARVRMLSQSVKGMKDRELKRAIDEIDAIASKSQLPRMDEFVALMKADGYLRRGENRVALDLLLNFYQTHPTTADLRVFKSRILRNIAEVMKQDLDSNKPIDVLNFYGKYSTTWLKNTDRIDVAFFQGRAFEQAGVFKEAEKIMIDTRGRLKRVLGTREEVERRVYEILPSMDDINLRIANVAFEQRKFQEASKAIEQIRGPLPLVSETERVQLGARISEAVGDTKSAISYLERLISNLKDSKDLQFKPRLQLAELYLKSGQLSDCDRELNEIERGSYSDGVRTEDTLARSLELRGDLQLKMGQRLAAVESYLKLLENFESQRPLSSVRYRAGQILFEDGDIKGAEKVWSGLNEKDGVFYRRLASEKMNHAGWQDAYKKYIERIPAAEGVK